MQLDFKEISANQVYFTMIQTIIPRPIAWVLSENESGNFNLAPFSYFTAVASDPPLLMFSIGKKMDDNNKDTLKNITERKEFIVHIASQDLANEVNLSAANMEYGESEVDSIGLETVAMSGSKLPRLANAKIAMACSLYEIKEIGNKPMSLVFGEVHQIYVCDSIVSEQNERIKINANDLQPLARLGGNDYASISPSFTVDRPK